MGSYTRDDAITYVYRALRDLGDDADSQLLTATEIGTFVDQATKEYSSRRPRTVVEDLTADGTHTTALPAGWLDEVSRVVAIEYPVGSNPPDIVDERLYRLYQSPDGWEIRWLGSYPGSGADVRLTYTALRSFAVLAAETTVLDVDFEIVAALAAAVSAEAIAAKYAQQGEPVLNADFGAGGRGGMTKVEEWTRLASRWRGTFTAAMDRRRPPATGRVNWDSRLSSGDGYLTHSRWRR